MTVAGWWFWFAWRPETKAFEFGEEKRATKWLVSDERAYTLHAYTDTGTQKTRRERGRECGVRGHHFNRTCFYFITCFEARTELLIKKLIIIIIIHFKSLTLKSQINYYFFPNFIYLFSVKDGQLGLLHISRMLLFCSLRGYEKRMGKERRVVVVGARVFIQKFWSEREKEGTVWWWLAFCVCVAAVAAKDEEQVIF